MHTRGGCAHLRCACARVRLRSSCQRSAPAPLTPRARAALGRVHRSEKQTVNAFFEAAGPGSLRWYHQVRLKAALRGCVDLGS